MELFNEHKNRYFMCIEKVINDSVAGTKYKGVDIQRLLVKERFLKKNHKNAYENLDFKEALLNEHQGNEAKENLNLICKTSEGYYKPLINQRIPIRPQLVEKQWLLMMLNHPKAGLFLEDSLTQKLKGKLQALDPIYNRDWVIEKNMDISDDPIESETFRQIFRVLLQAIQEKKLVKYTSQTKNGKLFKDEIIFPYRIEFSPRNNKFRLSTYSIRDERPVLMNLSSIQTVEIIDESIDELTKKAFSAIMAKKAEKPLVLEIKSKHNAVERCFSMFSFYEKTSTYDRDTDKYLLKVDYFQFEEKEIIRDILTLGSSVTVLEPDTIRNEVIARLKKAVELLQN